MAGYLVFMDKIGMNMQTKQWHVGKALPYQYDEEWILLEIQASGHELEAIQKQLRGVPNAPGNRVGPMVRGPCQIHSCQIHSCQSANLGGFP